MDIKECALESPTVRTREAELYMRNAGWALRQECEAELRGVRWALACVSSWMGRMGWKGRQAEATSTERTFPKLELRGGRAGSTQLHQVDASERTQARAGAEPGLLLCLAAFQSDHPVAWGCNPITGGDPTEAATTPCLAAILMYLMVLPAQAAARPARVVGLSHAQLRALLITQSAGPPSRSCIAPAAPAPPGPPCTF